MLSSIPKRAFSNWSMALIRQKQMTIDQVLLCQGVRSLKLSSTPEAPHLSDLNTFLAAFQMWI